MQSSAYKYLSFPTSFYIYIFSILWVVLFKYNLSDGVDRNAFSLIRLIEICLGLSFGIHWKNGARTLDLGHVTYPFRTSAKCTYSLCTNVRGSASLLSSSLPSSSAQLSSLSLGKCILLLHSSTANLFGFVR